MKKSLIIIGVCLVLFGLLWHFIPLFQVGTIFLLDEICNRFNEPPPLGSPTPQWRLEGACNWLPVAVMGSYVSTSGGIVLIISGFIVRRKKQKV